MLRVEAVCFLPYNCDVSGWPKYTWYVVIDIRLVLVFNCNDSAIDSSRNRTQQLLVFKYFYLTSQSKKLRPLI